MIEVFHDPRITKNTAGKSVILKAYAAWLCKNRDGFLLDRHRHANGTFRGLLHRADCKLMNRPVQLKGALNGERYKACSNDLEALGVWAVYVHPIGPVNDNGNPQRPCRSCRVPSPWLVAPAAVAAVTRHRKR